MKKAKKCISLLLLTAAATVVLAGCSTSEEAAQTSSSPEASPSSQISSSSQTSASSQTSSTTSQLEPLSQEWKSINEVGEYQGMLDSPSPKSPCTARPTTLTIKSPFPMRICSKLGVRTSLDCSCRNTTGIPRRTRTSWWEVPRPQ